MTGYLIVFAAVALLTLLILEAVVPFFMRKYSNLQEKRAAEVRMHLEESFIFWERKKMTLIYFAPLILAGVFFLLTRHIIGVAAGFLIGFIIPKIMVSIAKAQRIKKFRSQLVDGLMIISSSLKAGLSFLQAIEVLCEEMPPPISQEFNLILSENKLGMNMEDSLRKLRKRIPVEEVNLAVSSILIAREAGGNLPLVLSRLTDTIRDNLRLKEKIGTLTLQGKLQGVIMMALPFAFAFFIYKQNPGHFDVMLQTPLGKKLLALAVVLQLVGMFLIKKISTMKS